ncbi:MAG: hypothetical protein WBG43_08185 [Marinifilaceae bacterium]
MLYIIIGIIALIAIVIVYTLLSKPKENEKEDITKEIDPACCGAHEICDLDLKKLNEEIEYFDDEELDTFISRPNDKYSEVEIDIFRDILYSLKPEEIREWITSLEIRKVNLPEPLKQEVLSLLA